MSKVRIVAGMCKHIDYDQSFDYIGVDRGAILLKKLEIPMVKAIGDFDSISTNELKELKIICDVEKLNPIKDDSDSEHALKYVKGKYDEIEIYGVIGGRVDHFLSIYKYLENADFSFSIIDDQNIICKYVKGVHHINKQKKYLSLLTSKKATVSLTGVKYELSHALLDEKSIFTISNEIINEQAKLEIEEGSVVVIQSDDKKK